MIEQIILEVFYCFLYVAGLTYVLYKVNLDIKIKRCIQFMVVYTFVNYLLTDIIILSNIQYVLKNILVFIYDFIYACLLIKKIKRTNLIVTTLYYVMYGSFLVIVVGIYATFFKVNPEQIMNAGVIKTSIVILVVFLTCFCMKIFYVLLNLVKRNMSLKEFLPFVCLNVLNMFIIIFFLFNYNKPNRMTILSYVFILIIIQSVFVNYLFVKTIKNLNEEKENELLEYSNKLNMKLLDDIKQEQEKIAELKHDMKNHLFVLEKFSEDSESKRYINELKQELILNNNVCNTGNLFVDACLNSKIHLCKDIDIKVIAHLSNNIFIQDKDLCSLIFNLLDNAIEAAQKSKDKEVRLKMIQENNSFVLKCVNSCDNIPEFKTKKKGHHGYGLRIINKILVKYDGKILTEYKNGKFSISIYFSLHNKK